MQNKYFTVQWASLRRSIPLSLRSYDRYPSINSPTFVVGDNNFDVTKGKSKDYYNLLIREKAKPPNIIQKLQSNFHFNSDNLKQIFKLPHSIVVESYVKAFQYKVINSILYTNTKLYKIGFRTNDLCTFCDNQPESLTHLFYHCSRSKQFWIEFELFWCQRIRLCLENACDPWNFDGKCLPFTSFAELFYNYWKKTICGTVGANKSFQTFMDLGRTR